MRAFVLSDERLVRHAGQFVWLEIDTEKAENAVFLERFPVNTWPTFMIVDPAGPDVVLKWLGSGTATQMEKLLEDGAYALHAGKTDDFAMALVAADRAYASGKSAESAVLYRALLDRVPPAWRRRDRAVESLVIALQTAGDSQQCAGAAIEHVPTLLPGPSSANATAMGLSCALEAPAEAEWRPDALSALEKMATAALTIEGLLADDRSGLFELVVDAREAAHDDDGARQLAAEWLVFLEAQAASAPSAEARAAFDAHRVAAALKLHQPQRVLTALKDSERDLPTDYNAPARLALVYREMDRLDDAAAAALRALRNVHGPRRIRVLETLGSIYEKKGDPARAGQRYAEALTFLEELPEGQRPRGAADRLRARLTTAP